jgi:DHA1 family multidrug resistance protein-like MFS transporter
LGMEADSLTRGWKRNLYVIWVAELVAIAGFTVVIPFLPYYVQELGVTDPAQVAIWSGLVFTGHGITMAILAPIWGSLADRHGRKLMVERAMFGGAILLGAMGFVGNVQQLAILRTIQGGLTGTIPAATTLIASSVPRRKSGYALGLLQMAIYVGASAGPLLGGLVADTLGYRATFWVTAALLFTAGVSVFFLLEERVKPSQQKKDSPAEGFWQGLALVLRSRALLVMFGIRLMIRLGLGTISPMLPLFVQSLTLAGERVASITGLVSGVGAATSALGAVVLGRVGDRIGYRRVMVACALGAAVLYAPQSSVTTPTQLLILQAATGVVLGGIVASVSATLANLAPKGRQGVVYGLDTSATSVARAVAPMIGAAIAAGLGLRFIFLFAAGIFALTALGMARPLVSMEESR